ncbi:MAG: glycosyltransferase family 4 protein [Saccharofermentanales bacterium]
MNIGFVSSWLERGASYVTKLYIDALMAGGHKVFVYARSGEEFLKDDPKWNLPYVTWGLRLAGTNINKNHFYRWIRSRELDVLFFNEQQIMGIVASTKTDFPALRIGSYIDYYKETTIPLFHIYDFIICNTKRHCEAFENHPQCYYVKWGTDVGLFTPRQNDKPMLTFFHSMGMSTRKGTDTLIEAFIEGGLYQESRLVIHTQMSMSYVTEHSVESLAGYNIEVINKTVTAPGLYHLGDVYVYPTRLDGLGLTLYEALACGLPVITTDHPPMNEVIDDQVGALVKVRRLYSRADGYYWPLSMVDKADLIDKMRGFIEHRDDLDEYKRMARSRAVDEFNWEDRYSELNRIFNSATSREVDRKVVAAIMKSERSDRLQHLKKAFLLNTRFDEVLKKLFAKKKI